MSFHACMGETLSKLTDKKPNTMTSWPDPVVVPASSEHTASLIFLHGLGDTGHGWASTLSTIKPSGVKLICPSANKMPVTLNSGFTMPSWFDLKSLNPNGPEDEAGIKRAAEYVVSLIEAEVNSFSLYQPQHEIQTWRLPSPFMLASSAQGTGRP